MNEINPNQEQLSVNSNLQEIKDIYSEAPNTTPNQNKIHRYTKNYIVVISLILILYLSLVFISATSNFDVGFLHYIVFMAVATLPLVWFLYWFLTFYKTISWSRYRDSILTLFIVAILSSIMTLSPDGDNTWNFGPFIFIGVHIILFLIWSFLIVPIFILYHRNKKPSFDTSFAKTSDLDNNISSPVVGHNRLYNKPLIIIFLVLFLFFIADLIMRMFFGFGIWSILKFVLPLL
jgi:hypothetical protein